MSGLTSDYPYTPDMGDDDKRAIMAGAGRETRTNHGLRIPSAPSTREVAAIIEAETKSFEAMARMLGDMCGRLDDGADLDDKDLERAQLRVLLELLKHPKTRQSNKLAALKQLMEIRSKKLVDKTVEMVTSPTAPPPPPRLNL